MICHTHTEKIATHRCTICEKPICGACVRRDSGKPYCGACLDEGIRYNRLIASSLKARWVEGRSLALLSFSVATFLLGGTDVALACGALVMGHVFTSGSKSRLNDAVLVVSAFLVLIKLCYGYMKMGLAVTR